MKPNIPTTACSNFKVFKLKDDLTCCSFSIVLAFCP